jgi:hypothetical protein
MIYPGLNPAPGLSSTPIQIMTISSVEEGYMIYDMNLAFAYLFLANSFD